MMYIQNNILINTTTKLGLPSNLGAQFCTSAISWTQALNHGRIGEERGFFPREEIERVHLETREVDIDPML